MSEIKVDEPLTSHVRPPMDAILTIRIIKSFPYRNVKSYILNSVNLKETTPKELLAQMKQTINTAGALRPYRTVEYDTLKIYTKAHGSKSMNLVINMEHDDSWVLVSPKVEGDEKTLWELGVENETEISLFKWDDYESFKANPEEKW